ncbi:MAG: ABC transporter ATP-binding protein [Solibacillus sp.]
MDQSLYAIDMKNIVKKFGSVTASDDVNFQVKKGEIHALLGENGAGKSTIMSMLSGIYRADSGTIAINGEVTTIRSPKESMTLGIGMVHQNFRLVDTLTAIENIILGETTQKWRGFSYLKKKKQQIEEISAQYGLTFPTDVPIWQLSVGEQQRVEIVKTLYKGADIIIFDEPTSVLTPGEVEQLLKTMLALKKDGKTMIITTHKLKEVMSVADRISIMRKGKMIAQMDSKDTSVEHLASLMVEKAAERELVIPSLPLGSPILQVENLVVKTKQNLLAIDHVNFSIQEHEIVGVAGVAGNGQKQLAETLTGLMPWTSGDVRFSGEVLKTPSVQQLIDKGIAHIPENRMKSGLAGGLGIVENLLMKSYRTTDRAKVGFMKQKPNAEWSAELVKKFDVRTPDLVSPVRQLSGGNQQKLLFAREMDLNPKLMIAVHPTQGLDVGATKAVHEMLLALKEKGSGTLLISEDLDEVMQLSDKILVLYNGKINGVIHRDEADKKVIGQLMAGLTYKEGDSNDAKNVG